jgi:hypothetical protein
MLWLNGAEVETWSRAMPEVPEGGRFFLSSTLAAEGLVPTASVWDQVLEVIHPFELPWRKSAGISRGFLIKQGIYDASVFRLQSETFAAFASTGQVIKRIRNNLVREYFIEQLEHMSEYMRANSVYPRYSLGPYQRVVSKGAYIFPLSEIVSETHEETYRWLIPSH